jgi:hypothetical protein
LPSKTRPPRSSWAAMGPFILFTWYRLAFDRLSAGACSRYCVIVTAAIKSIVCAEIRASLRV